MLNKNCSKRKLTRKEQRDLDIEISFMEGVVQRDAKYVEAWKALSEKLVKVDFANAPLDVFQNRAFKCVMAEGNALKGVTFAVIGSEQYIDEEGNRQ